MIVKPKFVIHNNQWIEICEKFDSRIGMHVLIPALCQDAINPTLLISILLICITKKIVTNKLCTGLNPSAWWTNFDRKYYIIV